MYIQLHTSSTDLRESRDLPRNGVAVWEQADEGGGLPESTLERVARIPLPARHTEIRKDLLLYMLRCQAEKQKSKLSFGNLLFSC